ncbi:hypothetical protein BT96DRAFT_996765 [Gymnopus androsaceus JB14]|uniref:Uncharacterized protein n=1 Tax=Gymnopus androsaceus JB14 TaxID=1447944 RepID=A0A6A4GDX9_9AGAR|nr:hypothetical protein BT96DRAFT_951096 [Gymnopus androsaceus JB14]KAE9396391.1 hypothetical protein BT96DRAFT_996765 [Gymnopus androsaceus JB14]
MQLLRLVLFGQESLTATKFKFSGRLVGRQWGVKSVNPLMIAFAAIAAKYIISDDVNFVEIGQVSNIPYHQEFYKIQRFLKSVENSDYYKQLILFWNHRVFKGLHVSVAKDSDAGDEDSDVDDMTAAMMAVTLSKEPAASGSTDQAAAGIASSTQAVAVATGSTQALSSPVTAAAANLSEIEQEDAPALHAGVAARTSDSEAPPQCGGHGCKAPSGRGRKKATQSEVTPAEPRPPRHATRKDK